MKHTFKLLAATMLFGLLLVTMGGGTPVAAQGPISFFPNYAIPNVVPNDARMICVSGTNLATFAGQTVEVAIAVPAGTTSFGFDIFNGNSSGLWSIGSPDTIFNLRADPSGVGSGTFTTFATWRGNSTNTPVPGVWTGPTNMVSNDWWNATVFTSPAAQGPNGNYFYRLLVSLPNPNTTTSSCFKLRSTATIYLPPETIWGVMGAIGGNAINAFYVIYPGFQWPMSDMQFFVKAVNNGTNCRDAAGNPQPCTTYDGRWTFYFNVPVGQTNLDLWDGDFDNGTDPARPNGNPSGVPVQQCTPTHAPNVPPYPPFISDSMKDINGGPVKAFGSAGTYPGSPADDAVGDAGRRSPCVYWKVTDPTGNVTTNTFASGNSEWDLTAIAAPAGTFLPAGVWRLDVVGLDLSNISFFRFPSQVVGNCGTAENPAACPIPPLFGSIGDTVWKDSNANGVQDSGETGVPGVTVNLLNSSGTVIATTTTDASGKYLFSNLAAGTYKVQFVAPAGYAYSAQYQGGNPATDSNANTTTGLSDVINLPVGFNDMTIDAGLYQPASLGNYVWEDLNGNGVQDAGEPGLAGVAVNLLNSSGAVIATTQTDANGYYKFSNLMPGTYSVEFVKPAGYTFTGRDLGGNDTKDSDANVSTGKTGTVTLTAGQYNDTLDAGLFKPASLGDYVWNDANRNGVQDAGELGVAGVTVNLLDASGKPIAGKTATTDTNGLYSFTNLVPGTYGVQFVLPTGYVFSPTDQGGNDAKDSDANTTTGKTASVTLAAGDNNLTLDAGVYQPASLGNYVWEDRNGNGVQDAGEPVIAGVTVKLLDGQGNVVGTTTTDANGYYKFSNLKPGTYSVEFVKPAGYTFTGQDLGGDDAKDSDANVSTGKTATVTLAAGQYNDTLDAGLYKPVLLGDYVWLDSNRNGVQEPALGELGIAGVTVKLLDASGAVVGTTTTNATGYYLFSNLKPGVYSVQFSAPSGMQFSPADQGDDAKDSDANASTGKTGAYTLLSGQPNLTVDAGLYKTTSPGTGTPGYWMNHPEAWPVAQITIGGKTYTRDQAIAYMRDSTKKDVTYTMFQALVAAKLNVGIGNNSTCISGTIASADAWMAKYPVGSGIAAGGADSPWRVGEPLYLQLDAYNNGKLCAPHRQ